MTQSEDKPLPLGVSARTGRPLRELDEPAVAAMLEREHEPAPESVAHSERSSPTGASFALEGGIDAGDLSQAGWGILFAPNVGQAIKDALAPLVAHRRAQGANPCVVFDGPTSWLPGDTAVSWLARQGRGVRLDVVNPDNGVPFYLLLVGPPEDLPFEFQYGLDLYWAVGRLWLPTADDFRSYADSVIAYETASAVPTSRQVALFSPEHEFDAATQLFNAQVSAPLQSGEGPRPAPLGTRQRFQLRAYRGADATKDALDSIVSGTIPGGAPSILFSGGHGMEFDASDPLQAATQGALVCQDWPGFGAIDGSHWYAASDVSSHAKVHGLIHVMFACYGGGCPSHDEFDRLGGTPRQLAERAFFSRLPQRLLSDPGGGALAVLAHIDRAWAYSFQAPRGGSQVQGFRDVLGRLMIGERIGQATDSFNLRWAALSTTLAEYQLDAFRGADVPLRTLGRMWVARDDARNFVVLGDPAVRIRVEDLSELP
jgi:hypothetical protein